MHHLGLIAHQAGVRDEAVELVGKSIETAPGIGYFYRNFYLSCKEIIMFIILILINKF